MIRKKKKSKAEGIIEKRNALTDKVAVIWSRVSTAEQFKHNNSIQTQIDACMEYCARNGIRRSHPYLHRFRSGTARSRGSGYHH